jgi:hypothetical protein
VYLVGMTIDLGLVVALALVLGVSVAVIGLLRAAERSGGLAGQGRSTGIAGALAEVDAILQPQRPTAEQLERLRRGEHEDDDDEGDDDPPPEPLSVAADAPSTRTPDA